MKEITGNIPENFRIGWGSFVDKTLMPFVSTTPAKLKNPCESKNPCEPAYTFRNNMALDSNYSNFFSTVSNSNSSSNLDAPEAGLDAMMQGKYYYFHQNSK